MEKTVKLTVFELSKKGKESKANKSQHDIKTYLAIFFAPQIQKNGIPNIIFCFETTAPTGYRNRRP